jgi:hypothetical protein
VNFARCQAAFVAYFGGQGLAEFGYGYLLVAGVDEFFKESGVVSGIQAFDFDLGVVRERSKVV